MSGAKYETEEAATAEFNRLDDPSRCKMLLLGAALYDAKLNLLQCVQYGRGCERLGNMKGYAKRHLHPQALVQSRKKSRR